jgi:hypothetical protein
MSDKGTDATGSLPPAVMALPSAGGDDLPQDTIEFDRQLQVQGPSGPEEVPFRGSITVHDGANTSELQADLEVLNPYLGEDGKMERRIVEQTPFYFVLNFMKDRALEPTEHGVGDAQRAFSVLCHADFVDPSDLPTPEDEEPMPEEDPASDEQDPMPGEDPVEEDPSGDDPADDDSTNEDSADDGSGSDNADPTDGERSA